jgi:hypothetical protein
MAPGHGEGTTTVVLAAGGGGSLLLNVQAARASGRHKD